MYMLCNWGCGPIHDDLVVRQLFDQSSFDIFFVWVAGKQLFFY